MPLPPGTRFGAYEIRTLVGSGGMGDVYRARDTRLNRDVALKVLRADVKNDPDRLARLRQEAQAVAALEHPHICRLYDVGPDYLVIEYVEGTTLSGPLPVARAAEYGLQILDALGAAHAKGIIHRDLKPANILVTGRGITLLDFGIATAPEPSASLVSEQVTRGALTQSGVVMGTPGYMAPELWRGNTADARSDIYSFGAVLLEMLNGPQTSGGTASTAHQRLHAVVAKCLAGEPADRYQTAAEAATALSYASRPSRLLLQLSLAAGIIVLIAVLGLLWQRRSVTPPLTDQDVLVIADFDNQTADPVFATALRQALAFQLQESPFLKAMDDAAVRQALAGSSRASDATLTSDIARDICVREGHKATLEGSIASVGATYLISLQAVNCASGEVIAREQATAERKESVVSTLAGISTAMRRTLGESLSTIDVEPRAYGHRVTTSSLEALQAFYMGDAEWTRTANSRATMPYYERAVELDPNFAMALAILGLRYASAGDEARYREHINRAYALVDRVSPRERLFITSEYHQLNGETEKTLSFREVLARTYPRDSMLHFNLALSYRERGEWEKAYREGEATIRTGPKAIQGYSVTSSVLMDLERIDEARAIMQKAIGAGFDTPLFHGRLLYIALASGDDRSRDAELDWFRRVPDDPRPLREQGNDAMARGAVARAAEFFQRADALGPQQAPPLRRYTRELRDGSAVLGDCSTRDRSERTAIIAALCGTTEALQTFAANATDRVGPVAYARGLALLRAGRSADAAALFDEMITRRVANWGPEYPAALVGRARAAAAMKDAETARHTYDTFFMLWKDADANVPLLLQARKEVAALR